MTDKLLLYYTYWKWFTWTKPESSLRLYMCWTKPCRV